MTMVLTRGIMVRGVDAVRNISQGQILPFCPLWYSYLSLELRVPEVLPVAVLGCVHACGELAVLPFVIRHRGNLSVFVDKV